MADKAPKKVKGFRITTKRDGFRRAGREWTGTIDVAASELDKEQLKQLMDEAGRMLVVQEIQMDAPKVADKED